MTTGPQMHHATAEFRGARFTESDLSGVTLRECDVRGLRVVGSSIDDVDLWAFGGELGSVRVEGVDVSAYVRDELDRRYPERVPLRELTTADDFRALWKTVEDAWTTTVQNAEKFDESQRNEQVGDEWSATQTLRHLVFAIDLWLGRMVLGSQAPFHPLGLPPGDPSAEAAELGLTPDATPSWHDVVAIHRERSRQVGDALAGITDADLGVTRTLVPIEAWGEETHTVANCFWIIAKEHVEHRRYAERDLAGLSALTHRRSSTTS